jgi:DnaJ-class molecular chaperone
MLLDRGLLLKLGILPDEINRMNDQERKKALKKAYHKMAQLYHPDKWDEATSEISYEEQADKFKEIHHAYKMITDASYRDGQKNKKQQPSLHAVLSIDLNFEQAFFGMETTITFTPTHVDEEGEVIKVDTTKDVHFDIDVIKVKVPRNTKHGDRIIFKNKGMKQGQRRGDLIFVLNVYPHPKFNYDPISKTFISHQNLDLEVMLGGGEIEVETLFGLDTVRVPAGTTPGTKLKKSKIGPTKEYNIEVEVDFNFPDKKKLKDSSFWDKLDIDWEKEEDLDEEIRKAEEDYEDTFEKLGGWTSTTTGSRGGIRFGTQG